MGYFTYYDLKILPQQEEEIDSNVREHLEKEVEAAIWISQESMKWYTWEEDMVQFSKLYPDLVFELWGEGEDRTDNWKARFKNGEAEIVEAEIIYPDFEKIKLESETR